MNWESKPIPMTEGMMQLDRALSGTDTFLAERRERIRQERYDQSKPQWEKDWEDSYGM